MEKLNPHHGALTADFLLQQSPAVTYACRANGDFCTTFITENVKDQFGHNASQFTKDPNFWLNNIHPGDQQRVLATLTGEHRNDKHVFEYRFRSANGSYNWIRDEFKLIRDSNDNPQIIIGCRIKIHDQIDKNHKREEQEYAHQLLNVAGVIMLALNPEGNIFLINEKGCSILGFDESELLEKNWFEICIPERLTSGMKSTFKYIMAGKQSLPDYQESTIVNRAGDEYNIAWHNKLLMDSDGEIIGVLSSGVDVTRQKQAEERQAWFGRLLNSSSNEIYIFNSDDLRFVEVNEGAQRNLGYSMEELYQMTPVDLNPALTKDQFKVLIQPLLSFEKNTVNFETYHCKKDGSAYPIEIRLQLFVTEEHPVPVFVASIQDITERKKVEKALEESQERFDLAMRGANDGLWDWNLVTNEVYFSPRWKSMLGYEEDETPNHLDVHADDLPRAMEVVQCYIDGKIKDHNIEFRMRHKDGHYVDILSRGTCIHDESGNATRIVGTHVDISERKHGENLLRESENKFRTIFDSTHDAIMLLDEKGFFDCNKATLNIFGCTNQKEFCSKHPADLSPPTQPDGRSSLVTANERIAEAMQNGSNFFEWSHRRINGEEFPAEVLLTTMELEGRCVIEATVRDISERKKAEQLLNQRYEELQCANKELKEAQAQLLQSEKMASIGQLAAGVAHEINNPVGYVSSNITSLNSYVNDLFNLLTIYEQAESLLPEGDIKQELQTLKEKFELEFLKQDIDELVKESIEGVTRVKQIVQDLKDFSHVDEAEWQFADLHNGLDSTLNIVHNELKYKAEIIKEYSNLPHIECMHSQLNQVFMNLLVNASHAIDEKGKVYIRTGREDINWVWVEIEDTGKGIPEENLNRIFEPFFTTKEIGKGTGLGLSLAYRR